jgi:lipid A ethanolaminephosphotransferase
MVCLVGVICNVYSENNNREKFKMTFSNLYQKLVSPFQHTSKQTQGILLVTAFIMLTGNFSLFERILEIYPFTLHHLPFLISLVIFFSILSALFFLLICHGKATRWILVLFLILASQTAYYMDKFGVIIDVVMMDNIMQTNRQEFAGLMTGSLLVRTIFFGLIPAWLVLKYFPKVENTYEEFKSRLKVSGVLVLAIALIIAPFTSSFFSFWREHKITRFYANPTYTVYSVIKYATQQINIAKVVPLKLIAQDAVIRESPSKRTELIIMVVGETARADRFSLNGYHRETNPLLVKQDIVSLSNVSSCGTSTSVSVPCMFSSLGRKSYDKENALNQENALDVLFDHGVQILWRDNNSDSKGVATRIKYEDFKSPTLNLACEGECRDIGMLSGLDQYIQARKGKDILIVLHQMGNHGPEYYRRYPKEFEKFKPMCMTGELQDCTQEEIDNSYDNAILYTDYFLSKVIDLLKKYDNTHATGMLYVSDHGESLGENGFYLHAAPYMIAPKEQTHVPAIVWMGKHFDYKKEQLMPYKDYALSHDDIFCSLLVAFEIDTKVCEAKKEMLQKNLTFTVH